MLNPSSRYDILTGLVPKSNIGAKSEQNLGYLSLFTRKSYTISLITNGILYIHMFWRAVNLTTPFVNSLFLYTDSLWVWNSLEIIRIPGESKSSADLDVFSYLPDLISNEISPLRKAPLRYWHVACNVGYVVNIPCSVLSQGLRNEKGNKNITLLWVGYVRLEYC